MKNWKNIPIPQLMLDHCERDPRELPVPYVVLKDRDGKHHFKINDSSKTVLCMMGGLCTICGQRIPSEERWLVGGIASAFDEHGYYIDHPVHKECGQYALQICPYLAIRNYNSKMDIEKMQEELKGQALLNNPAVDQDRLPLFVFGRPSAIKYVMNNNELFVVPIRPFRETEFWCDGEQITTLPDVLMKIQNTKWEKYGEDIRKLPGWEVQIA